MRQTTSLRFAPDSAPGTGAGNGGIRHHTGGLGAAPSQPAAAWGAALVRRAGRAGLTTPEPADLSVDSPEALGERLLAVVAAATGRGWDVEDALREAVRRYAGELDAEAAERALS